jgi:polyisoprenoid-binding protein YceI
MSKVTWNMDPTHSELGFKVKHMMVTNLSGKFSDFSIQAASDDEQFSNPEISFSAKIASVNTGQEQRDTHLRSAEFFDAEVHPEMTFKATKMEKLSDENYKMHGDLSIKGVTKPVALDVEFGGIGKDPLGNTKAGFTVNGKIKRSDFGLTWNATLETGGVLVSDEVRINSEIQLVKGA